MFPIFAPRKIAFEAPLKHLYHKFYQAFDNFNLIEKCSVSDGNMENDVTHPFGQLGSQLNV